MKKIVFALLIAVSSALMFTACTEEEISPSNTDNGGGGEIVTIKK